MLSVAKQSDIVLNLYWHGEKTKIKTLLICDRQLKHCSQNQFER